jgi:hypothetical protein
LINTISIVEETYGPLKVMLKSKLDALASPDYHPELDNSKFLNDEDTNVYQSYIGIIH